MKSKLEENIKKLKQRGLIPSMTKGKQRWKVTYLDGKEDIFMSINSVKKAIRNGAVKVEKKRVKVKLKPQGTTTKDLIEEDVTNFHNVTGYYRRRNKTSR